MTHTTSQRAAPSAWRPAATTDYIAEELRHYDEHLRDVRGLAAGTRQDYVEADLAMKERALARLQEPEANIQRYRAPDSLIAFLKTL